jgi:hypothetical protein
LSGWRWICYKHFAPKNKICVVIYDVVRGLENVDERKKDLIHEFNLFNANKDRQFIRFVFLNLIEFYENAIFCNIKMETSRDAQTQIEFDGLFLARDGPNNVSNTV